MASATLTSFTLLLIITIITILINLFLIHSRPLYLEEEHQLHRQANRLAGSMVERRREGVEVAGLVETASSSAPAT